MDNICKICNNPISERKHFWNEHRIKEADYYVKYEPKYDLYDKSIIVFKSIEQYTLADFNNKINLRKYIESLSKEAAINYLIDWLTRWQQSKKTVLAPSEFEIKSINFPSIKYIEKTYGTGTYADICSRVKYACTRYEYKMKSLKEKNKPLEYIIDTREQSILHLPNFQVQKLNYGDYSIANNPNKIYIERKSLTDFIGTLSQGYERFVKELERCQDDEGYLIVLIEEKYSNLLGFNYLPHCKRIQATPDFIMHRAREILRNYPLNLQMLAVDGRKESARVITKIFSLDYDIERLDLQYYYNMGLL